MWADTTAEIHGSDQLASGDVNHRDVLAVTARLANAGVAVDRNEGKLAVGRCDDFMSGNAAFSDLRDLPTGVGINDAERGFAFVSDQQVALALRIVG